MSDYVDKKDGVSKKKGVLVTGPDGFVGRVVCKELLERGYAVRGAQWDAAPLPLGCESVIVGSIESSTDWKIALKDVEIVIHLAARVHVMNDTAEDPLSAFRKVNVDGSKRLAEYAADAGIKHFVFVSSVKVNGESTTNKAFSETDLPNPEDPYAVSKYEAEQLLREIEANSSMCVTILRPPLLYGPGVKANFLKLIKIVDRGIPLPFGSVVNKRSLMGLGNFIDLISHCIEHPAARGETFVVSDGQDLSTADLVRKIASALNKEPRIFSLSPSVLRAIGRITGKQDAVKRLTECLEIDSTKVRRVLAWTPPFSVDQELARTAEWYLGHIVSSRI